MDWSILSQIPASSIIDGLAVIIGVLTGVLYAIDRKYDIIGVIALGLIAGYGGGVIRDILLRDQGFFFMEHGDLVVICIIVSIIAFALCRHIGAVERPLFYLDAFSMGWFALAGTSKAVSGDVGLVLSVVLGVITAVGGGVIRNICAGETPTIFKPGNFYAISALAGSLFFVTINAFGAPEIVSDAGCVAIAFGLTILSDYFDWHTSAGTRKDA